MLLDTPIAVIRWSCFFALFVLAPQAWAGVSVSLPLQGYYHPGRYMPVRVSASGQPLAVRLSARGAVTTEVNTAGDYDGVVPWLVLDSQVASITWHVDDASVSTGPSLHALQDNDELVGIADEGARAVANEMFPDHNVIAVAIDTARLAANPSAWETLDAVVLSPALAASIRDKFSAILACGTELIVCGTNRPDGQWPWRQQGGCWVLSTSNAPAARSIIADAYIPTFDADRGWPEAMRRKIMLAGVVYCILTLALMLWRSRWTIIAVTAFSLASIGLFLGWYFAVSPALRMQCGIVVSDSKLAWLDRWTWVSTLRPVNPRVAATGDVHPIFANRLHMEACAPRLIWNVDRQPEFEFHLEPRQTLAFVDRSAGLAQDRQITQPAAQPFAEFADKVYCQGGAKVVGQFTADSGSGGVVAVIVIEPTP